MQRDIKEKSIVIFGAGKIGRSFIGQLFGCNGYKVIFVDVDQTIINGLNEKGCYRVIIKGNSESEILVPNVQAISALESDKVAIAVSEAAILAVSVGKNALERVIPVIAKGLKLRYLDNPCSPLNIIIAENMRDASPFIEARLIKELPSYYPIKNLVGLVETSIGKMVPIMTSADLKKDLLMVFAEPYNTLIVDKKGFIPPIPDVAGLAPKENIKAWVDRKAFIHNLGHATAAYFGSFKHPDKVFMYEVLEDAAVLNFTKEVMQQSAKVLKLVYPGEFRSGELEEHIDDLLFRFRNKALKDTVFRVGADLVRKLGTDDRFMGIIHLAQKIGMPYDKILNALSYGFCFNAKDEFGNSFPSDKVFMESLSNDFESTLVNLLGFDPAKDPTLIKKLKELYYFETLSQYRIGK